MSETQTEGEVTEGKVMEVLGEIYDPEIPIDIVNLGLVYGVRIDGSTVNVDMTMTSPGCPAATQIVAEAKYLLEEVDGVSDVNVEIVWDPPWDPGKMSEAAKESLGMF